MPITMGALATATLMGARPKDTNKPVRILTPQLSSVLNVPGLCWGWMPESPVFFFNGNLGEKQTVHWLFRHPVPANLVDSCLLRHPPGGSKP